MHSAKLYLFSDQACDCLSPSAFFKDPFTVEYNSEVLKKSDKFVGL